MPAYQRGQTYLLFLREDSEIGLASPIGLGQGAFRIIKGRGGDKAVNAFNNLGLFRGMEPKLIEMMESLSREEQNLIRHNRGPVDASRFIELIKELLK